MIVERSLWIVSVWLFAMLLSVGAGANEARHWDQARIATLAGELHEGVRGLREDVRRQKRDLGSAHASAYYRLLDDLRSIDHETHHLHRALESGATREETLPTYARIATLRRDCAEEMRRLFLEGAVLERVVRARAIVPQMDPYYGFDPARPDHERVIRR